MIMTKYTPLFPPTQEMYARGPDLGQVEPIENRLHACMVWWVINSCGAINSAVSVQYEFSKYIQQ